MYLLSLFAGKPASCDITFPSNHPSFPPSLAGLCGIGAVGIFLDHFLWEIDPTLIFISVTELAQEEALTIGNQTFTSFQYLINTEGYNFIPLFQYSFYLEVAG